MAAATVVVVAAASGCATAQQAPFELALRNGSVLAVQSVVGDAARGFDVKLMAGDVQHLAAACLLGVDVSQRVGVKGLELRVLSARLGAHFCCHQLHQALQD